MKIFNIVELAQAIEDGKKIEMLRNGTYERFYTNEPWNLDVLRKRCEDSQLRIAPEAKTIPLEILIDSGIDCEFSDHKLYWEINQLVKEVGGFYYAHDYNDSEKLDAIEDFECCRPRYNHWHHMDNIPQARKDGLLAWLHKYFVWDACSQGFNITGVKDGYKFAWESDL